MRKEEYINEVISKIENKKARREVEKELSAHIDDRISYYTDAGWDEEAANEKAMEHMGEPEKVSVEMSKLHDEKIDGCLLSFFILFMIPLAFMICIFVFFWRADMVYVGDYYEEYIEQNYPTAIADRELVNNFNPDDYTHVGTWDPNDISSEHWRLDYSKLKPTRKIPTKKTKDETISNVYFQTNYDGVVFCLGYDNYEEKYKFDDYTKEDKNENEFYFSPSFYDDYLIKKDYMFPDFENSKVNKMLVCDIDFSSAFTDEESKELRRIINVQDYDHVNKLGFDIKVFRIGWQFEETDILENDFGYFIEKDGKYFITNEIHRDDDGKGQYATYADLLELNDDITAKVKMIIENNKDKYESAKNTTYFN